MSRGPDSGKPGDSPPPGKDPQPRTQRLRAPAGNVSLAAVAEIAGVSEATVSRVLNRKYGVSAATRESVELALRKIGYARALHGELVVLLVPNLIDPIFAAMCDAIETDLRPYGLRAVVCPGRTAQERDYVESTLDAGVVAVVFVSSSNTTRHGDPVARQLLLSRGIPFLGINGGFPDTP